MEEITAACREQDIGADQVNQAIQQLDKVIQQNTSAAEQMSATSEELAAQAEQLQASISFFQLDDRVQDRRRRQQASHAQPGGSCPRNSRSATTWRRNPPRPRLPAGKRSSIAAAKTRPLAPKENPASTSGSSSGLTLNLGAGGDAQDSEFERY